MLHMGSVAVSRSASRTISDHEVSKRALDMLRLRSNRCAFPAAGAIIPSARHRISPPSLKTHAQRLSMDPWNKHSSTAKQFSHHEARPPLPPVALRRLALWASPSLEMPERLVAA